VRAPALLLAAAFLLPSPARASEDEAACRSAYSPDYAAVWRLAREDWDKGCAARTRSGDILRDAQRVFMDACVKRFPPRADLPAFEVQVQCARGTVGETRLAPPPPAPSAVVAPRRLGAEAHEYVRRARPLAAGRPADVCFAGFMACLSADTQNKAVDCDFWKVYFYGRAKYSPPSTVRVDEHGVPERLKADVHAPPFCIDEPKVTAEQAITIALANGLEEQKGMFVEVSVLTVSDKRNSSWEMGVWEKFPQMRGKVVWYVAALGKRILLDPGTGAVLARY
jgi:hypothetical protein